MSRQDDLETLKEYLEACAPELLESYLVLADAWRGLGPGETLKLTPVPKAEDPSA